MPGSPALGYALPLWTPPVDYAGAARPAGGPADAGAYENG
ncbi:MAG: choice-of-anchor Q domain-containing protein [Nocardioidaceae bacterium]